MENNYFYSTPTQGTTETYLYKVVEDDTTKKIIKNENRDRYVAARMIYDNVKDNVSNISITETDLYCPYDLTFNYSVPVSNNTANCEAVIEIKERFMTEEMQRKYPNMKIKVSKYNRIKKNSNGKPIYYFVLINEKTGLIFDITDITKLKDIDVFNWRIKKTQMDSNSEYVIEPTYIFPPSNAIKTVDISQYYKDYYDSNLIEDANNIQTKEKN